MANLIKAAAQSPEELSLLQNAVSDLSDHSRLGVYADWLNENGDARGQFINTLLDRWNSGGHLPSGTGIPKVWRDVSGMTLLRKLREQSLEAPADKICGAARPAILIRPKVRKRGVPLGRSKFGGLPDLPLDIPWPKYKDRLQSFLCQFNLEEISPFVAAKDLPPKGMLYFFVYDDDEETGHPGLGGVNEASICLFSEDPNVNTREPSQDFYPPNRVYPECRLSLTETLDLPEISSYNANSPYAKDAACGVRSKEFGILDEDTERSYYIVENSLYPNLRTHSHLLGWAHQNVIDQDPVRIGFRNLLQLGSENELGWSWADAHQFYYSLPEEDLPAKRFDRTEAIDG